MLVEELIELLTQFDPKLPVGGIIDGFEGTLDVTDVEEDEGIVLVEFTTD